MTSVAGSPRSARVPALTAAEIAALVGGTLTGDGKRQVTGVGPLDRAGPDELSFLADRRYAPLAADTRAGVLLVSPDLADATTGAPTRIVVAKPYDALVALLPKLYQPEIRPAGVDPTAVIGPDCTMGSDVTVGAFAVIGRGVTVGARSWIGPHCVVADDVVIGEDTRLVSQVTCYPGSRIGDRVTLHAGVRIGSDGFGYAFGNGAHQKIPHVGQCIIGPDVEIGANSCVDRGSVDDTTIGAGTKIDNLVHIAHNVRIGRLCLVMAQVGVAGSARIEDGAILAGQAGIAGHATVGANSRIAARGAVFGDIPPNETWSGYPARPHSESLRASAALFKLSHVLRRMERFLDTHE